MYFELETISKKISQEISGELERIGVFFRIFSRIKSLQSIKDKLVRGDYLKGKLLQDLLGIRITVYFLDDIKIITNFLKEKYIVDNRDIDRYAEDTFKPVRLNVVLRLDDELRETFDFVLGKELSVKVDTTFEVQIRSMLSEGWHEVEHDLRYKCKADWQNHKDLSRALNGIYATLETGEWSMLQLFKEISYRHYKEKNWEAMLRNVFRLRIPQDSLSPTIASYLDSNTQLAKELYKIDRIKFLSKISASKLSIPLSYNNLIYIVNHLYFHNKFLTKIEPELMINNVLYFKV